MLTPEEKLIHDLVNSLTIIDSKLQQIIEKSDNISSEELLELTNSARERCTKGLKSIQTRVRELQTDF